MALHSTVLHTLGQGVVKYRYFTTPCSGGYVLLVALHSTVLHTLGQGVVKYRYFTTPCSGGYVLLVALHSTVLHTLGQGVVKYRYFTTPCSGGYVLLVALDSTVLDTVADSLIPPKCLELAVAGIINPNLTGLSPACHTIGKGIAMDNNHDSPLARQRMSCILRICTDRYRGCVGSIRTHSHMNHFRGRQGWGGGGGGGVALNNSPDTGTQPSPVTTMFVYQHSKTIKYFGVLA